MALAPTAAAPPANDDAGAPAPDDMGAEAAPEETGETVKVTISKLGDGSYMVYAGDEPEEGEGDESAGGDDTGAATGGGADTGVGEGEAGAADATGAGVATEVGEGGTEGGGAEGAPQGQHCDSVGSALKAAMTILHNDEAGEGGAEGAFQSAFGGDTGGTPPLAQKY